MRNCVHCAKPISSAVMIRGRWKAIFCSPECRAADKIAIREARRGYREQKGACPSCGHKVSNSRGQTKINPALQAGANGIDWVGVRT